MRNFIKTLLNENLTKYAEPPYDDGTLNESGEKQNVVGVLIKSNNTERVFLILRNDKQPKWALMSGTMDKGETPMQTLKREIIEELKINPKIIEYKKDKVEYIPEKNRTFHYFEGFVNKEFKPTLNSENLNSGWFNKDDLPSPLYQGLKEKIARI
jgi:8-oxo-dGTP pyrophosphatase MutT (NUDIX family)